MNARPEPWASLADMLGMHPKTDDERRDEFLQTVLSEVYSDLALVRALEAAAVEVFATAFMSESPRSLRIEIQRFHSRIEDRIAEKIMQAAEPLPSATKPEPELPPQKRPKDWW